MKSPYTKYGTIAAGLFIATIFLFPSMNIFNDSILLADVQKKIFEQKNCIITGTRILTTNEEKPHITTLTVHKYLSRDYGYVDQTFDEEGNLLISLAVHHPSNIITVLLPQMNRYLQFPIPQKYQDEMKEITPLKLFAILFYDGDPKDIENTDFETLDITTLNCVKKAQIQGLPAVGFEFTDLGTRVSEGLGFKNLRLFFDMQRSAGFLWVNPDTLLPVQLDAEVILGKCILTGFTEQTLTEVDDHFEWNIEMDEGLFMPQIPEGYQMLGVPRIKSKAVIGISGAVAVVPLVVWIRRRRKDRSNIR